jgi:hypothetical protein
MFYKALEASIQLAQDSFGVADGAHVTYGYLARAHEMTMEALEETLRETQAAVRRIKDNMSNFVALLRRNHEGLIAVRTFHLIFGQVLTAMKTCQGLREARENIEKEQKGLQKTQGDAYQAIFMAALELACQLFADVLSRADIINERGMVILLPPFINLVNGVANQRDALPKGMGGE